MVGYIPSVEAQLDNALGTVENLQKRIAELEAALEKIADGCAEPNTRRFAREVLSK
jgi:hypothetical protein